MMAHKEIEKKQYQNQPSRPAVCTVVVLPIAVIVVFGVVEHPSYHSTWYGGIGDAIENDGW